MRQFLFTSAVIMALFLSYSAVMAQDKLDEFQAFRDKLNANRAAQQAQADPLAITSDPLENWRRAQEANRQLSGLTATTETAPIKDELAGAIIADSKIVAVTVYNDRARVTRLAVVDVPQGQQRVVFKDMPEAMISDTLRTEGEAQGAEVKFGALSSKRVMMTTRPPTDRNAQLTEEIAKLRDEAALIGLQKSALEEQQSFLKTMSRANSVPARGRDATEALKPEQWISAAKTMQAGLAEIIAAQFEYDKKLRNIEQEIANRGKELSLSRPVQSSTYAVIIPLEAAKATKLTVEISYQIMNASWRPIYDARLSTEDKGALDLIQYGEVWQKTGEDWTGVDLTLSTAQPQRNARFIPAETLWIDAYPPMETGGWFSANDNDSNVSRIGIVGGTKSQPGRRSEMDYELRKALEAENERKAKEAEATGKSAMPIPIGKPQDDTLSIPAQFATAILNTEGFLSEFRITGPSTVPSDGTEVKVMVGTFAADSKLRVFINPAASSEAYLVTQTVLKGEAPLYAGKVNLFRDGAYTGQSFLPMLRPGQEHLLSFGVDDQVAVQRKTLLDKTQEEGVIAKDSILQRSYVTEIQNLHKIPMNIVVKEATPVPRTEKARVMIQKEATTSGYKEDVENNKGVLAWEFEMKPKEKKELKLGWSVNWPKDHSLSGL